MNYLVYKFLGIKAYRFKDIKSGHYMIKDLEQRCLMKGKDLAENFAQWFDELYLGKYDLIPFFKVSKISDNEFDKQNYELTFNDDVDFVIHKLDINIHVNNVSKTYGEATDSYKVEVKNGISCCKYSIVFLLSVFINSSTFFSTGANLLNKYCSFNLSNK